MTLREQIVALDVEEVSHAGWDRAGILHLSVGLSGEIMVSRAAVLAIIDQHRCVPDRDALARALHNLLPEAHRERNPVVGEASDVCDLEADAIIAALEEQPKPEPKEVSQAGMVKLTRELLEKALGAEMEDLNHGNDD